MYIKHALHTYLDIWIEEMFTAVGELSCVCEYSNWHSIFIVWFWNSANASIYYKLYMEILLETFSIPKIFCIWLKPTVTAIFLCFFFLLIKLYICLFNKSVNHDKMNKDNHEFEANIAFNIDQIRTQLAGQHESCLWIFSLSYCTMLNDNLFIFAFCIFNYMFML